MPKLKTKSGAKKRFGRTATGKVKVAHSHKRHLWIQRINAGARQHGLTYSQFMHGIKLAGLDLDRKVLSDIAIREPEAFQAIAATAQAALDKAPPAATAA